jgi:hypothetical protein
VVQSLLLAGATAEEALIGACLGGHVHVAEYLHSIGADIDTKDNIVMHICILACVSSSPCPVSLFLYSISNTLFILSYVGGGAQNAFDACL